MAKGGLTERVDNLEDATAELAQALVKTHSEIEDLKKTVQQWMEKSVEESRQWREKVDEEIKAMKMVRRLTESGIYVMVMGEETMEIVNYDEVRKSKG